MRVVYFGSGTFSVPSLKAVLASGHEVAGVFTQPARPAGRGVHARPTPVAEAARQAGCAATETPDINGEGSRAAIAALRPEVICVADFGQMIRRRILGLPRHGVFNVHASLLPELRGAAPINWAIIRGHATTGVTTFRVVPEMDAGPIYLQAATEIGPQETAEDLKDRLAAMGAELACRTLDLLAGGQAQDRQQDHSRATLAPRLQKADGLIDWSRDARSICNLVRGVWPWPGGQAAFCRCDGHVVPVTIAEAAVEPGPASRPPGELDAELIVACGEGRVRIRRIRPAGKRLIDWRDFVNGYRVRAGDQFRRAEAWTRC